MKILITGVAGFIGFHLARLLLKNNYNIVGLDNLNDYYDISLKASRLDILNNLGLVFYKADISNNTELRKIFIEEEPQFVINLAAQAGVRHSLENPSSYISSNIIGFLNILEACKGFKVKKLIFASSSSVYGNNTKEKFSESDNVDYPLNIYAASKKSNELMAYSYSYLYNISCIGLRFFTVYGPWGRPDMAYFKFTKKIIQNDPIDIYGNGDMIRDFTYIDDIIDGAFKLISIINDGTFLKAKKVPYDIFNIGNDNPVYLNYFVSIIEKNLCKKAIINSIEMQPGDVKKTSADLKKIQSVIDFVPKTNIEEGIAEFIKWYKSFY